MDYPLDILLSTYNGVSYLRDQVDSLLDQSFSDWRLRVRDDGSVDGTQSVLKEYADLYPGKISLRNDDFGNVGVIQSFATLIGDSDAEYVALCDQDDIWIKNKLLEQMKVMQRSERAYGKAMPILVHTDLQVVRHDTRQIAPSFWKYQNLNPAQMCETRHLLVQNHMTGCTFLMNRALVKRIAHIPDKVIMHDWWIALIASAVGKVICLDMPTVLYRQHQNNLLGATRINCLGVPENFFQKLFHCRESLYRTRDQAEALLDQDLLNKEDRKLVYRYAKLFNERCLSKRKALLTNGYLKQGVLRNFAMFVYI